MAETGEKVDHGAQGVFVVGAFLGVKRPAPYEIEGRKGESRPKIGLEVDGEEFSVVAADDRELYEVTQAWAKGEVVTLRVYPSAGRYGLRWLTSPRQATGTWE